MKRSDEGKLRQLVLAHQQLTTVIEGADGGGSEILVDMWNKEIRLIEQRILELCKVAFGNDRKDASGNKK